MSAIKIAFNPNGAGCKHVHIMDESSRLIEITMESVLSTPASESDSSLVFQIKEEMERLDLSLSDKAEMKTELEKASFDLTADASIQGMAV